MSLSICLYWLKELTQIDKDSSRVSILSEIPIAFPIPKLPIGLGALSTSSRFRDAVAYLFKSYTPSERHLDKVSLFTLIPPTAQYWPSLSSVISLFIPSVPPMSPFPNDATTSHLFQLPALIRRPIHCDSPTLRLPSPDHCCCHQALSLFPQPTSLLLSLSI